MKKIPLIIIIFIFSFNIYADPIEYIDDWYLLEHIIDYELRDQKSGMVISKYSKSLILKKGRNKKVIYNFDDDSYDIYLVTEKRNKKIIYIFNNSKNKLFKSKLDYKKIEFQEIPWGFGNLMAIFKNCDDLEKEAYVFGKIENNYFLSKYKFSKRPEELMCTYLIGGGRCELIYDQITEEYGVGDKMVISNYFEYSGDINSVGATVFNGCSLYKKLKYRSS